MQAKIMVGCAGWAISAPERQEFPEQGTQLQKYAAVLPAVEINSSFYRFHRPETYARWRDSAPDGFRFSVKIPKIVTHELRLQDSGAQWARFMQEAENLKEKLGCLLLQLPPSLAYEAASAERFFAMMRASTSVAVVCEPRHASWFDAQAGRLLSKHGVSYVIADPAVVTLPIPASGGETIYFRLHGSPRMYYSSYSEEYLSTLCDTLAAHARAGRDVWCVFDNTAAGAAMKNALSLLSRLTGPV